MIGLLVGAAVASKMINAVSEVAKNHQYGVRDMVFVNMGAVDFYQTNYLETIHNLLGMGFTNINVNEIRKHRRGLFNRNLYGQVESVTINGDSSFRKGARFAREAHVLVSFHVYKDSPRVEIPELYGRNSYYEYEDRNYQQPVNVNVTVNNDIPYVPQGQNPGYRYNEGYSNNGYRCEYCGSLIPNRYGFCPNCGAAIR